MKVATEAAIRDRADAPTLEMLNLWHSLCKARVGGTFEVAVAARRDHPEFRDEEGTLNTALPQVSGGRPYLVVYLETLESVSPALVTHEIGHWVLLLQGFPGFLRDTQRGSATEIALGSLVQHTALYALQRSLGHEPQPIIDGRALDTVAGLLACVESAVEPDARVSDALQATDDILNCSDDIAKQVQSALRRRGPATDKLAATFVAVSESCDLLTPKGSHEYGEALIAAIHETGNWQVTNVETLLGGLLERCE